MPMLAFVHALTADLKAEEHRLLAWIENGVLHVEKVAVQDLQGKRDQLKAEALRLAEAYRAARDKYEALRDHVDGPQGAAIGKSQRRHFGAKAPPGMSLRRLYS
jgi:hypothetical protein